MKQFIILEKDVQQGQEIKLYWTMSANTLEQAKQMIKDFIKESEEHEGIIYNENDFVIYERNQQ